MYSLCNLMNLTKVLIPMWWGGFSEFNQRKEVPTQGLNPHVVGRFFRESGAVVVNVSEGCLNPHVVGRFFRVNQAVKPRGIHWGLNPHVVGRFFRGFSASLSNACRDVLIPMWWGGFSEAYIQRVRNGQRLNPHVVGRFFRFEQCQALPTLKAS